MARWLVKTEPSTYSYDDLAKAGKTTWDGVKNPVALKHLRSVRKGDEVLVYHTGGEKAVVGIARAASDAYPDPKHPQLTVFDLEARKPLKRPVTLAEIKGDRTFAGWELVRLPRLSVMPVPAAMQARLLELAAS
jgi:predicted RNA-binding protein with PUA-like domain